jgi:hypothetical protein
MKEEILDVLGLWCWATFTNGVFKITRFCGEEVLAEVSIDEFFRNSTDIQRMGVTAAELPEGLPRSLILGPAARDRDAELGLA